MKHRQSLILVLGILFSLLFMGPQVEQVADADQTNEHSLFSKANDEAYDAECGDRLFYDDFEDPQSGWGESSGQGFQAAYDNG